MRLWVKEFSLARCAIHVECNCSDSYSVDCACMLVEYFFYNRKLLVGSMRMEEKANEKCIIILFAVYCMIIAIL